MDKPETALIIEDDAVSRRIMAMHLGREGYEVVEAENGQEGLDAFDACQPDVVLCDLRMPVLDGKAVLAELNKRASTVPVIVVSGTEEITDAIEALRLGAADYITKPIQDMAMLSHSVRNCLERARLERENMEHRQRLEETNRRLENSLHQLKEDETAARNIQFHLLPPPEARFAGYSFSRFIKTSAFLSGDFVDYFVIDDNHLGFYIADVSGHGVSSAFVTVLLKSTMSHLIEQYRRNEDDTILCPERVLQNINADMLAKDFDKYLTMFYVVLDTRQGTMRYANGGQFPPPILHDGGAPQFIIDKNLPVGLYEQAEYKTTVITEPKRFAMAMFSDGVLEILSRRTLPEQKAFLLSLLKGTQVTLESLVVDLGFELRGELRDDVTILLVKKGA